MKKCGTYENFDELIEKEWFENEINVRNERITELEERSIELKFIADALKNEVVSLCEQLEKSDMELEQILRSPDMKETIRVARIKRIQALRNEGTSAIEIAEWFSISRQSVYNALKVSV